MGNSIGSGSKKAKVVKINGEIVKLKAPLLALDVVKDYPGHVVLESEAVKRFGIRAKPLEAEQELKPKKIYFLVELPKQLPEEKVPRSSVHTSAKDRLDCLMLTRRSASDLSSGSGSGSVEVKVRLPRAQVEKLIEDSCDETEIAEKIVDLCLHKSCEGNGG